MGHSDLGLNKAPRRLIVGITGATGIAYGISLLRALGAVGIERHLVISSAGEVTRSYESALSSQELRALAEFQYSAKDVAASLASGSFKTMGMVIAPCSVRTLAEIASGVTSSLMTRAADVVLKERRRLVLLVRETPLHLGHLRNMVAVTEAGAIVMPPVPAFYMRPKTIDDLVEHTVSRVLDLFDLELPDVPRWGDPELKSRAAPNNEPAS